MVQTVHHEVIGASFHYTHACLQVDTEPTNAELMQDMQKLTAAHASCVTQCIHFCQMHLLANILNTRHLMRCTERVWLHCSMEVDKHLLSLACSLLEHCFHCMPTILVISNHCSQFNIQ